MQILYCTLYIVWWGEKNNLRILMLFICLYAANNSRLDATECIIFLVKGKYIYQIKAQ